MKIDPNAPAYPMTRIEFVADRDGIETIHEYCALMRKAYRAAILRGRKRPDGTKGPISRTHPYRRPWIEGYLEFRASKADALIAAHNESQK